MKVPKLSCALRSGCDYGRAHALAVLFVAITLYTGLHLAYGTPIGDVADEPAHISRAVALLHGQIFGVRHATPRGPDSGVFIDSGLARAARSELVPWPTGTVGSAPKMGAQQVAAARAISWSGQRKFIQASGAVAYFPAFYLPGALGVEAGALAGQRPLAALYTGRLFMLLAYIGIGALAISLARFGRPLLFAVLSLPMAVSLAASFNQDAQLLAASALCGALLTWSPTAFPKARLFAATIFALLLCSKPPYGLLLFACLTPLAASGWRQRLVRLSAFGLPALLWVIAMLHFSFTPVRREPYHPGPLWPGDPAITLHAADPAGGVRVLLADPVRIVWLPWHDLAQNYVGLSRQAVGVLGWLSVSLTHHLYRDWYEALGAAALATLLGASAGRVRWHWGDALWVLALIAASIIAVELSLYLDWTNLGGAQIMGVQGRYYLLLVPFMLLVLPRFGAWFDRGTGWRYARDAASILLTLPAILVALKTALVLPTLVARSFYQ